MNLSITSSTLKSSVSSNDRRAHLVDSTLSSNRVSQESEVLDFNRRKMSVVNLEAALSSWKSIKNDEVAQISQRYRSIISNSLRINPGNTGNFPSQLMSHWLGSR